MRWQACNRRNTGGRKAVFSFSTSRSILIKRTSITLDDRVYETGLEIAAQRGFSQSFSAYIAWLIQRDAAGGVTREEAPKAGKAARVGKATKPKPPKAKAKAAAPAKKSGRPRAAAATATGRKRAKNAR